MLPAILLAILIGFGTQTAFDHNRSSHTSTPTFETLQTKLASTTDEESACEIIEQMHSLDFDRAVSVTNNNQYDYCW